MRIAVLGGCGFVGSHVVDLLVNAGAEVVVCDDGSSCWLDAEDEPRFLHPDVGRVEYVDDPEFATAEVVVDASLRHPLGRELPLYREALDRVRFGAEVCVEGALRRTLRRFVVVSSLEVLAERGPLGAHLRAYSQVLSYLHRPPTLDVSFVHLPELYGPRQLPETGDVAAVLNDAVVLEAPAFSNLGYVGDAAAVVAGRALDARHRKSTDVFVSAPAVDAEVLFRVLEHLGRADAAARALEVRRPGVSFGGGFDELLRTSLADGLAPTIAFYARMGEEERAEEERPG